jgi:diguanylate cyclase (GGDEF)-like protein/PAS domain S-box-containing protein
VVKDHTNTILLVEKDPAADADILKSFGWQVIAVRSSTRAVELVASNPEIDLVIIDVDLDPAFDGARAAREMLRAREVPVVFFTACLDKEWVERVRGIPHYGYVPKAAGKYVLQSAIEMALERFEERHALVLSENRLHQITSALHEIVWLRDVKTRRLLYINPAFEQLTGYSCEEFYKNPNLFIDSIHPDDRHSIVKGKLGRSDVHRIVRRDGGIRWVWGRTFPVWNALGEVYRTVAIVEDITEMKHVEEELRRANETLEAQMAENQRLQSDFRDQAIRDPLTGLYNRRYLNEVLDHELARAQREGYPVCLVMIDVDNFKTVNDVYGHYAGDLVLINLARQLTQQTHASDLVCRLGGDEFLLVISNVTAADAFTQANLYRETFEKTVGLVDQQEIRATLSLGIAMFPDYATTSQALLQAADRAMYEAKARGRNCIV